MRPGNRVSVLPGVARRLAKVDGGNAPLDLVHDLAVKVPTAAIFQMLDPPCKGYCTNGHLRKFIESTGLEVQETEVNILTERISSTGDHDGFDRNDFVKYMAATREARDTAFDSDEEGEKT